MATEKPTVFVIGATGQTGRLIVKEFNRDPGDVKLRLAARKPADVEKLRAAGKEAVHFDLDDPQTFALALAGVERLFLLTGYTVDMLVQSKTLVDAAKKAGVRHIVHQGIFGQWDTTDPHFAWHQMIEKYIEASGIAWTHLHPNVFMDNLLTFFAPRGGKVTVFFGEQRVGWVALRDLAAVAAVALRQGPGRHGGKDYWLSPEVLTGPQVAEILGGVLGTQIHCEMQSPDVLARMLADSGAMEPKYGAGAVDFMRQVTDGRMGYIGTVRDDGPFVTGRPSMTLREWATENRESLSKAASGG